MMLSEQKKLRYVLDWAHRFISVGSEVHRELCRADALTLASEEEENKRETKEVSLLWERFPCEYESQLRHSLTNITHETTWPENRERDDVKTSRALQPSCSGRGFDKRDDRHHTSSMNQIPAAASGCISESEPHCCCRRVSERTGYDSTAVVNKRAGAQSTGQILNDQLKEDDGEVLEVDEVEVPAQVSKSSNSTSSPCHLKIPSNLSVYDQYQLCVEQLQELRMQASPVDETKTFTDSAIKFEAKSPSAETSASSASCFSATNADKRLHKSRRKEVTTKTTEEKSSRAWKKKQEKTTFTEQSDNPVIKESRSLSLNNGEATESRNVTNKSRAAASNDASKMERTAPVSESGNTALGKTKDSEDNPAGVSACVQWLCLPDEVWLSILSLLPLTALGRVSLVCRSLHTLTSDHTLWRNVKIENLRVTDTHLLFLARHRLHSLCLYNCSGLTLSSQGLEMFFTLCKNDLQEVKVISCTGPALHGDQILPLIGQLCDHVTSVDVSWSRASDAGVTALSGRSRLKTIVLNGCCITDDPLKKLIMGHKESLCRLEVFGCQYLTSSCLQTIWESCPGLKHLNIGQVPQVKAQSLTVVALQLKSLISLNLTGLQAVNDASVTTLLQHCVRLQSLTLCSCPGVSDLTLHNISKYIPHIRSLDVSGCKAVTDAGVQSLTLGCRKLEQLDLSSTSTGDRGVRLLANYCSGHLHTVKLSFCHVSSKNILKLCRNSKRLKVLHLYGCVQIPTETEIRHFNADIQVHPLT